MARRRALYLLLALGAWFSAAVVPGCSGTEASPNQSASAGSNGLAGGQAACVGNNPGCHGSSLQDCCQQDARAPATCESGKWMCNGVTAPACGGYCNRGASGGGGTGGDVGAIGGAEGGAVSYPCLPLVNGSLAGGGSGGSGGGGGGEGGEAGMGGEGSALSCVVGETFCYIDAGQAETLPVPGRPTCMSFVSTDHGDAADARLAACAKTPTCDCLCNTGAFPCGVECSCQDANGVGTVICHSI